MQRRVTTEETRCCIAGGGPAGMMLGFLLARAGVDVLVLEKHADFLRDFRGDTIHPSTLELMYELGFLNDFLARPHQQAQQIHGQIGDADVIVADFTHLPTHCRFIAFMPQWEFLNFLAEQATATPLSTCGCRRRSLTLSRTPAALSESGRRQRTGREKSAPNSSSGPMVVIRRSARGPD